MRKGESMKRDRRRRNRPEMLGDRPIEPGETAGLLQSVASGLDTIFNGDLKRTKRKHGFVLLVYQFDDAEGIKDKRCNYVSNGADRKDIVVLFKEMIARFEGQSEAKGRA